ncbi:MAG: hypothetical protein HZA93_02720 [Verrucomicrobia bacterium]|nr:hypothetical protein [Verrucomicrobiota bacterium]
MLGTDEAKARLQLSSHVDVLRFARRHALIDPESAAKSETNIAMLRKKLESGS